VEGEKFLGGALNWQVKTYYKRTLPHWHPTDTWLFITFCLFDALPSWRRAQKETSGEVFLNMDRQLDAANTGPMWLKDPKVADMVAQVLRSAHERGLCEIAAWVVMSNHVHLLMKPAAPAADVMKWIKGISARKANEILRRSGQPFWQHESYDHWVRTSEEYRRILRYIEWNPVKAGLTAKPELWPWSSATTAHEQAKACSTLCHM
jgi:putative transposase